MQLYHNKAFLFRQEAQQENEAENHTMTTVEVGALTAELVANESVLQEKERRQIIEETTQALTINLTEAELVAVNEVADLKQGCSWRFFGFMVFSLMVVGVALSPGLGPWSFTVSPGGISKWWSMGTLRPTFRRSLRPPSWKVLVPSKLSKSSTKP